MRALAVALLLLSSCAEAPKCRRVTMLKTEPRIGLFLPHWHLTAGDIILRGPEQVTIAFHTGDRLVMPVAELDVTFEECR
jgi:hypothetical protein